jgi:hypothetical protein
MCRFLNARKHVFMRCLAPRSADSGTFGDEMLSKLRPVFYFPALIGHGEGAALAA